MWATEKGDFAEISIPEQKHRKPCDKMGVARLKRGATVNLPTENVLWFLYRRNHGPFLEYLATNCSLPAGQSSTQAWTGCVRPRPSLDIFSGI